MVSAKRYKSNFSLECVNKIRSNAFSIDKTYTVPYLWKYATECSDVQNERYVNKVSRRELDSLQSGFRVTEMRWDFTANHICYTDCLEAFYNNNTYNWTTFWPFKTFAITLTYYYSNAITHLNALLLRSIVRVHGTINLTFFPHQLSSSRRIIIYNTAPARQYFRTYNLILMSVGYIYAVKKFKPSLFYYRFNLSYVANSLHFYGHFWNFENFIYIEFLLLIFSFLEYITCHHL